MRETTEMRREYKVDELLTLNPMSQTQQSLTRDVAQRNARKNRYARYVMPREDNGGRKAATRQRCRRYRQVFRCFSKRYYDDTFARAPVQHASRESFSPPIYIISDFRDFIDSRG